MNGFKLDIVCNKCGSTNVLICKHLDYTGGLDEAADYTGNIVLVCKDEMCDNKELFILDREILY